MAQTFYSIHDQTIAHIGIKGMKWGQRRFRNYDGTLTAAGKERYDYYDEQGGKRAVRKAEKQERRRQKILSDPKKLQKHFSEFTTAELQKAKERFAAQNELKSQYRAEQMAKEKHKTDIAAMKANTEKQKSLAKQQKLMTKNTKETNKFNLEKAKRAEERQIEKENKEAKATTWKQRMTKLSNILTISKNGKKIFDELGVTDPKDGETLFGSLGKAMGWDKKVAADVMANTVKEAAKESKTPKESKTSSNDEPPKSTGRQDKVASPASAFAGWEGKKDLTKADIKRQIKKEQKLIEKEWDNAIKTAEKESTYRRANDMERRMTDSLDSSKNANVRIVDNLTATLSERIGAFVDQSATNRAAQSYIRRERAQKAANKRWDGHVSSARVRAAGRPNVSQGEYAKKMETLFQTNLSEILGKYKG